MGAGEQILLCHSLESGPLPEYLDKVKQQQALHLTQTLHSSQLYDESLVIKPNQRSSNSTTTELYEAIKCVLHWIEPPTTASGHKEGPPTSHSKAQFNADKHGNWLGSFFRQFLQFHEGFSAGLEANDNLPNSRLSTILREHSHTLCRLRETLHKYYYENCIFGQEIASIPLSNHLNISDTITAVGTTTTAATTIVVIPDSEGLFGNDSIMDYSLNGPHIAGQPQLTYHWNFLFFVIIFIIAGGLGNILVCLAIGLDRKLQNVTNYFLLSLAIADLLVSLFVMPLGAIPTFLGETLIFDFNLPSPFRRYQ